jgi:hypothetical protein
MTPFWSTWHTASLARWCQIAALAALVGLGPACGGSTTAPQTPTVSVGAVALSGTLTLPATGQTSQLTATARMSDGTSQVVTNQAKWQSSNSAVATVSSTGLVSGVGYGTATITATFQGVSGTAVFTVSINMTGTWTGTSVDSYSSEQFTSVVLTQTGQNISGTFKAVLGGRSASGAFAGTVGPAGTTVGFTITGTFSIADRTCNLDLTGTGQLANTTFTATYSGSSSCHGAITDGQLVLNLSTAG